MVLVDTSVWVSHFRNSNAELQALLNEGLVVCHPFVIGELACGNLKNRDEILHLLQSLPSAEIVEHEEILQFIERHWLMGKGLCLIDIHMLASAILTGVPLWTLDNELSRVSVTLRVGYKLTR